MSQVSAGTDSAGGGDSSRSDDYISIDGLRKTFANGSVVAVDDVSLAFGENEFVVLLGPSGCGKTTTLRCIAGLEEPNAGRVSIGDDDVTYLKPKDRDLAFVFQSIALFPHMSVRKNMSFGLDMKTDLSAEEKNERVENAAEILDIAEMLNRKPAALSGGQQQRVSLGRAMVMEPDAFLLDEPFSALDANLRDSMRIEAKKLQRRLEKTMIFVTHDQEEAMTLGDKIVIMRDGSVQQVGSPYEIYNEPSNLFVAQFIGSPSTNIVECTADVTADDVTLSNDWLSLSLTEEQVDRFDGSDGQTVELGVRPEYLVLDRGSRLFEADVSVVEPHGARDAVHLRVGEQELVATTPQEQVAGDSSVTVDFDPTDVWAFDPDGRRLL